MFKRNIRITRTAIAFALAAGIAMSGSMPAFAADDTVVTVTPGSRGITNPAATDFVGRSITGVQQTTTAGLAAFTVTDLTGSGAGWNVTAQASQFTGPVGTPTNTLPAGSLSMTAPSVVADATIASSGLPSITAGPHTIDNGSAIKIASAAVNAGMGRYEFGATDFTLTLPALVKADTYTSSVTISLVIAP